MERRGYRLDYCGKFQLDLSWKEDIISVNLIIRISDFWLNWDQSENFGNFIGAIQELEETSTISK